MKFIAHCTIGYLEIIMLAISEEFRKELNVIGGDWVSADSGETFEVTNPATGETIGTVPMSGKGRERSGQ